MRARILIFRCRECLGGLLASLLVAWAPGCATVTDSSPELALHIRSALADAARRTGLGAADLEVVSAERVTWLDGALGCPEPGFMYTQALVPGYRIRIQAGSEMLDYHAGTRGAPLLCPPERAVSPASGLRGPRDSPASEITAARDWPRCARVQDRNRNRRWLT